MIVPQPQQIQTVPVSGVFWEINGQFWGQVTGPLASGQMPVWNWNTNAAYQDPGSNMVLYFPNSTLAVKS